jgi:hypothetical protein
VIPTSLSATALDVATKCLARYAAENIGKNRGTSSAPAMIGTSCHNALEVYVKTCYIDLHKMQHMVVFDTTDASGPEFEDGQELLTKWHERTVFDDTFTVISVEDKRPFDLPVTDSKGKTHRIPVNYIFDRLDQLGETEFRVVDYKTWRFLISPEDLIGKLQARLYGLAVQIQYPQATKIWVQFDQLRGERVGIVLTKEDNANTWRYIKKWAKKILDTEVEDAEETINPDCKWCIRKTKCDALKRNTAAGGVAGMPIIEMIDRRAQIDQQMEGLKWAAQELENALLEAAKHEDVERLASHNNEVYWTRSGRRQIERMDVLEQIVGPVMMERIGKTTVSMTTIDKLLKGSELSAEQKTQIKGLFTTKLGEPSLKTKPISKIDKK